MKKVYFLLLTMFLLTSFASANSNRCSFGNLERVGRAKFSVTIKISNADTLGGFQIPFSFDNEYADLVCDSISFVDSRCGQFDFLQGSIDNESKSALIMGIYQTDPAFDKQPLAPGRGIVAKAYFTVVSLNEDIRPINRRKLHFAKKIFNMNSNKLGFEFWTAGGESVDGVFENSAIDIAESEN